MTTTIPAPLASAPVVDTRPVPFTRLARVELRKMIDTRSGLALLAIVVLAGLAAIGATIAWGTGPDSLVGFLGSAVLPLSLLVPVIGIMGATAEWTQRTGLMTFTLEPRRGRVVTAKIVAAVVLSVVVLAATVFASALATVAVGGAWDATAAVLAGVAFGVILYVLQGVAFGMALLNTPSAIVASLVLPTVWTIVATLSAGFRSVAQWLDLTSAIGPLTSGAMTGTDWAHLASSAAVWIGLPLAVGTWRVMTREVK